MLGDILAVFGDTCVTAAYVRALFVRNELLLFQAPRHAAW